MGERPPPSGTSPPSERIRNALPVSYMAIVSTQSPTDRGVEWGGALHFE